MSKRTGKPDAHEPAESVPGSSTSQRVGSHSVDSDEPQMPKIVVKDRRRVDPVTGVLRPPADVPATGTASVPPTPASVPVQDAELVSQLEERTADLQRITAEYANYRKRTEREREVMTDQGVALALSALLPILDDVERAREHGDLTGGFATVAEQLSSTLNKLGLTGFGDPGDVFDPTWHEAVAHTGSGTPHITSVLRRGYALGERMLRPALVVVGDAEQDSEGVQAPAGDK